MYNFQSSRGERKIKKNTQMSPLQTNKTRKNVPLADLH